MLESACIKASQPENDYNIDALMARIAKLEKALQSGQFAQKEVVSKEVAIPAPVQEKPVKQVKKQVEEFDFPPIDDGYPDVPPIDMEGGFYGDISNVKKVDNRPISPSFDKKEEKSAQSSVNVEQQVTPTAEDIKPSAGGMSGGKLWGKVIRQLRADKNIVLWVACQEMDATLVGRTLRIIANDDAGYQAIVKESNLATLSKTVKSLGDFEVEVVKAGAKPTDGFDSQVEKVRNAFPGANIKIED